MIAGIICTTEAAREAGADAARRDATASGQAFRGSIRAAREAGMAEGSPAFRAFVAGYLSVLEST